MRVEGDVPGGRGHGSSTMTVQALAGIGQRGVGRGEASELGVGKVPTRAGRRDAARKDLDGGIDIDRSGKE